MSVLPFGVAAAGYLWLLVSDSVDRVRRFGRRFTGDGRDVDVWEPSPLSAAGRRLGVVGVVIAMLLPLLVPGMTSGLIDRFGTGQGTGERGPGSGRPARPSTCRRCSPRTSIRTKCSTWYGPHHRPGAVLPAVRGVRPDRQGRLHQPGADRRHTGDQRVQDVAVPDGPGVASRALPGAGGGGQLRPEPGAHVPPAGQHRRPGRRLALRPTTDQVFSPGRAPPSTSGTTRSTYVRTSFTPTALRTAGPFLATDGAARDQAAVPPVGQVTNVLRPLLAGKIQRVRQGTRDLRLSSVRPTASSTRCKPATGGTSGNAIVDFLNVKKGFCVQYAAAMAWLVRAAGFPARVAFGFTRGSGPVNGLYTLTNLNLHAWTEVLFPGFGWVPFDATPGGSVAGSVPSLWAPDTTNPPSGDVDVAPDVGDKDPAQRDPGELAGAVAAESDDGGPGAGLPSPGAWVLVSAAGVVVLLLGLLLPAWRRRALRRGRRAGTAPATAPPSAATARRDAHAAWAEASSTP